MKRVIWIVLDSVGMGELPDADKFGDVGANTIGHIAEQIKDFKLPNMSLLGYGNIDGMQGISKVENPIGAYGRLAEKSCGKDTVTGHWEMTGIYTKDGFPVYPNGFPEELMEQFMKESGVKGYLANKVASGTAVIEEYGKEHEKTGYPIIYTSADSVFQIAAKEDIIPLERLYEICIAARKVLTGKHQVARVIARPFVGEQGSYKRTANRRDFAIVPNEDNTLVHLKNAGLEVAAVGKIEDIFAKSGITKAKHTKDNMDGMDVTLKYMEEVQEGLIFTNLVEFDSVYGHRRNVEGYAKALMEFDARLPEVFQKMNEEDILIITADHGCDPAFKGTDHTREYVPLILYGKNVKPVNLHTKSTFADIGQTVCDYFQVSPISMGTSVLNQILL